MTVTTNQIRCRGLARLWVIGVGLLLAAAAGAQVVDNALTDRLTRVFPEIERGYIDLNGNGAPDQTEELDERVPESTLKDARVQGTEILDFVLRNVVFLSLDQLDGVQQALAEASGVFPDMIALQYAGRVDAALDEKRQMIARGVFNPVALRQAQTRMRDLINQLVTAYRKQGRQQEREFVAARDGLLTMVAQSYPLPSGINDDEQAILVSMMMLTAQGRENGGAAQAGEDGAKVAAVRTLGQLRAEIAVDLLLELIRENDEVGVELRSAAIAALGEIGSREALTVLLDEYRRNPNAETAPTTLRAIGRVGGPEGAALITGVLRASAPEGGPALQQPSANTRAALDAAVSLAKAGRADRTLLPMFQAYSQSPDPELRALAVGGLSGFRTRAMGDYLVRMLNEETHPDVRLELIRSIDAMGLQQTVPTFVALLRAPGTTDRERIAVLEALGNSRGAAALPLIVEQLGSESPELRGAARDALIRQHQSASIVEALGRTLIGVSDRATLREGTAVLAQVANPGALAFLQRLLASPYPEVKRNVTWALYRVQTGSVPIVAALQDILSSESEAMPVRVNAARAIGRIRIDSPQLGVAQSLLEAVKLRGDRNASLRYYAMRSLGELGSATPEVVTTLTNVAVRDQDPDLKRQAVRVLGQLAVNDPATEDSLVRVFRGSDDAELRLLTLEALGDMRANRLAELAPQLLVAGQPLTVRKRLVYALSQLGNEAAISLILDTTREPDIGAYVVAMLADQPAETLLPVLRRRLQTEDDADAVTLLEQLQTEIESRF